MPEVRQMSEMERGFGPPKTTDAPPPYEVAAKLPTYEESQREKAMDEENHPHPENGENTGNEESQLHFISFDEVENGTNDIILGTDFIFLSSFFVAVVFNWIGFLLLMCLCHTVAGRYGALAGFGLSLAKWTLIFKHSANFGSSDNSWLCWLIMACGILICFRAVIQYLCIKREWHRLSRTAQERMMFLY